MRNTACADSGFCTGLLLFGFPGVSLAYECALVQQRVPSNHEQIMRFNSVEFIFLFLPLTLCLYFFIIRLLGSLSAKLLLLSVSMFFYAWWNPAYLVLIMGSYVGEFRT
jgi:hypothetical protein